MAPGHVGLFFTISGVCCQQVSEMEDHVETLGEEKSNIKARLTETLSDKQSIQHKYSQVMISCCLQPLYLYL